jgi:hypothetical protein
MKRITYAVLCLLFWSNIPAQVNNTYLADLQKLYETLQKTPSYRDQIKGQKLIAYQKLYENLKKEPIGKVSSPEYFLTLSQLFFPIQDNHLMLTQINYMPPPSEYPVFKGNLDSLKSVLSKKSLDEVEGLYHYGDAYSIGFFKDREKRYLGVIFDSNTPIWTNGQIAAWLYETEPNYFRAIYAHPKSKNLLLYAVEKFLNRSLVNSYFYVSFSDEVYRKTIGQSNHVDLPTNIQPFRFKSLSPTVQYLQIKHFSAMTPDLQKSQVFFDSIKNSVNTPNLILDLRNNGGGSYKASKMYHELLKTYSKQHKIYVLINNGTLSQGEIFTLQLKKLNNVKILGQTSKGMITYGSNFGTRVKLPSGAFEVYITDMNGKKEHIPYENYGIKPDFPLSGERDWIEQVMEMIRKE